MLANPQQPQEAPSHSSAYQHSNSTSTAHSNAQPQPHSPSPPTSNPSHSTSHSPSPSRSRSSGRARSTLGDKISALSAKLSRTLGSASVGEDAHDPSATATADDTASVYSNNTNGEPRYTGRYTGRGSLSLTRQRTADSDVSARSGASSAATAVGGGAGGAPRAVSRGRDAYSTGRGGAGNIRQQPFNPNSPSAADSHSPSHGARIGLGPDDYSVTRGREPVPYRGAAAVGAGSPAAGGVYSTGRGGAGNLRSPSRDPNTGALSGVGGGVRGRAALNANVAEEEQVIREYVEKQIYEGAAYSTGRGGAGNITSRSRSKSQTRGDAAVPLQRIPYSPSPPTYTPQHPHMQIFSTGRGGAGNIVLGDGVAAEVLDEEERRRVALAQATSPGAGAVTSPGATEKLHSTGRGGGGNITSQPVPPVEAPVDYDRLQRAANGGGERYESHGRGGAGNMAARGQTPAQTHMNTKGRSRSRSRVRD